MKGGLYLAASFQRQKEIREYAKRLREYGVPIVSTWHDGTEKAMDDSTLADAREYALRDLAEIRRADALIVFTTDAPHPIYHTGGLNVELGYALALHIPVVLVGPRTNVFHTLVDERKERPDEFFAALEVLKADRTSAD